MGSYGDYCPIAVGNEVVGDRWSPLILREIMVGSHGFNDIHRGIPRISRTLLAQRLRRLERDGLVERHSEPGRQSVYYDLTDAGRDLEPVIFELGRWASRWVFGDPRDDQLDVANFVWRLHQFTNEERAPQPRTTIEFDTRGPGGGRAWLVFDRGASTACLIDPGYEPALVISGDLRELCRWFAGRTTWRAMCDCGRVEFAGPARLVREFPRWFNTSDFYDEIRRAARRREEQR